MCCEPWPQKIYDEVEYQLGYTIGPNVLSMSRVCQNCPFRSLRNQEYASMMSYATIIWLWAIRSDPFDIISNGFLKISTTYLVQVQVCYVLPHG